MDVFWISMRNIKSGAFGEDPGTAPLYLRFGGAETPSPAHRIGMKQWAHAVVDHFRPVSGGPAVGDLVFFLHGYNNSINNVLERHRALQTGLAAAGFPCLVVSYDWPSDERTLAYLEDRHDAKRTAFQLVKAGISLFIAMLNKDCQINIHVVAHSMGSYVLREAFDDADDTTAAQTNWTVAQVALIAGDVSAKSFASGDKSSESLYRHAYRVTNYFNREDAVLQVSNVKRVGMSPRVGRVGLPADAPDKAVNVDCTERYAAQDVVGLAGSHSWYFDDQLFLKDLAITLKGAVDRTAVPTRRETSTPGVFQLSRS